MLSDNILFSPFDCFFCMEPITVFEGRGSESICTHHIDWNPDNNIPENVAYAHGRCHVSYHHLFTVLFKHHNWDHGKGIPCKKCLQIHTTKCPKKYNFSTKANWKTDPNAYSNEYHKKLRRYLKKQKQKEM